MLHFSKLHIFIWITLLTAAQTFAGNPERSGQAGATQLMINPYARSSGINGINVSFCKGIESTINNPAGLAAGSGTEVLFCNSQWLVGSGVSINTFGFSQKFKNNSAIGLSFTSISLGQFIRTTTEQPDGGLGTFSPSFINIGVSYAKTFNVDSNQILVGFTTRIITESIPDAQSTGICFDGGIQYLHPNKRLKMGVSLRNIGPSMNYTGDGLSTRANIGGINARFNDSRVSTEAVHFELNSVLSIGASYVFNIHNDHTITPTASFISNSYYYDQIGLGFEYSFKSYLAIRGSYLYEENMGDLSKRRNAYRGLSYGVSLQLPLKKGTNGNGPSFGVDYGYAFSGWLFTGLHTFGARLYF